MEVNSIFVYGTLKKGFSNYKIIKDIYKECYKAEAKGKIFDYRDTFPAMILGNGIVKGELYVFNDLSKIMPKIDYIEGYEGEENENNLYDRIIIDVYLPEVDKIVKSYVYVFRDIQEIYCEEGFTFIESGEWK